MPRQKLTPERLLKRPKGHEELWDSGKGSVSGLCARGGPRGWVFNYRGSPVVGRDGKSKRPRVTLGAWSPVAGLGLSLREARVQAAGLANNTEVTHQARPAETVRALAERFFVKRYPENEVRRAKVRQLLENHCLPTLGGKGVREVTRRDCNALVALAQKSGRSPAVELIRVLQQLFRFAVKEDYFGKDATEANSPAALLELGDFGITAAESRERWLSAEELKTLFLHKEIDLPGLLAGKPGLEFGLSVSVRAAIVLGPHLAVRPKALIGLRWDEVNFEKATASIGGGRGAKQRFGTKPKVFVVPLSETAVAVLTALKQSAKGEWVFPSASSAGHLSGDVYADAMARLSARLELPGGPVRPHDARRTFANTAINLRVEQLVVERCLQHKLGGEGETYLGDSVEQRRREAHALVDAHWTAVREGIPAKVVSIRA